MDWMLMPYRRYADFSGRSTRQEFWMFYLLVVIVVVVLQVVTAMGATSIDPATGEVSGGILATIGGGLLLLFWLGTIIPYLAVAIRRMHDQDRSGWWILCPIANIVFLFIDGTPGTNRFGPDPKGRGA